MYRIIITVDNPVTQKEFENQLRVKLRNMDLVFTRNTHETMAALMQGKPSMLLLDMDSYQVDTLQILAHLTQNHPDIPCFILGNHAIQETKVKLVERTYHYIKKPFDMYNLTLEMTEVLRRESHQVLTRGIPVKTFLQLVNLEKKTCLLGIYPVAGEKGLVYFKDGILYDAVYGTLKGEAAAVKLLAVNRAEIRFKDPGKKVINRQINISFAELMAKIPAPKDVAGRPSPLAKPAPAAPVPPAAPKEPLAEKSDVSAVPPAEEAAQTIDYFSASDMPAPRESDIPADRTAKYDPAADEPATEEAVAEPAGQEPAEAPSGAVMEPGQQEPQEAEAEESSPLPSEEIETDALPLVDILDPTEEHHAGEDEESSTVAEETIPAEEPTADVIPPPAAQDETTAPMVEQVTTAEEVESAPMETATEEAEAMSEEIAVAEEAATADEQEPMATATEEVKPTSHEIALTEEAAAEIVPSEEQEPRELAPAPPEIEEEATAAAEPHTEELSAEATDARPASIDLQTVWNDHLGAIRAVRGYKAAALISPAGDLVAFDSTDSKIHLDAMGGTFNAIFWLARDAYLRAGLESFGELALRTPRGIVVMTKPATGERLPLQSLCILGEDGDQRAIQERLGLLLQDIMAKAS